MPVLTRRRSHDSRREIWLVFYGDIPVGTIAERAGVPANLDQWGWACGFYPGVEPRQHPVSATHAARACGRRCV
jgi:hypothetical protein